LLQALLEGLATPAEKQERLRRLAADYPYFAPARLALLQALQPDTEEYVQQVATAQLLFNNAHWLNFRLNRVEDRGSMTEDRGSETEDRSSMTEERGSMAEDRVSMTGDWGSMTEDRGSMTEERDSMTEERGSMTEDRVSMTEDRDSMTEDRGAEEDEATVVEEPTNGQRSTVNGQQEPQPDDSLTEEEDATAVEEPVIDHGSSAYEPIPMPGPLAPHPDQPLFEPLHAVDYFASQGIKLSEEAVTGDRLGLQLKSFTEWLKSMKKTHDAGRVSNDAAAEAAVQHIAEKSNTEDAVVTEAMAEVFALQGLRQKAIDTYRKLSLLNPAKSAYFAAKIEDLK
jgi:hypothetical protein